MIKLIIFDFDGTIADTKKLYYAPLKNALGREGIKFGKPEFAKTLGLKLAEIARTWGVKDDLTLKKISNSIHHEVFSNVGKIKTASDMIDVKDIYIRKIIISNTDSSKVREVLEKNKINFFDEIHGGDEFIQKSEFIKDYLKDEGLNGNEVIYLGDMARDVLVAHEAGCISVVISHKFSWNTNEEIANAKPDFIITKFADLKKIVKPL